MSCVSSNFGLYNKLYHERRFIELLDAFCHEGFNLSKGLNREYTFGICSRERTVQAKGLDFAIRGMAQECLREAADGKSEGC